MEPDKRNDKPPQPEADPLDDALADSFPASDPVSITVPTRPGAPKPAPEEGQSTERHEKQHGA